MNFNEDQILSDSSLRKFFLENYAPEIKNILIQNFSEKFHDFYINLSAFIDKHHHYLGLMINKPVELLIKLKKAVIEAQKLYLEDIEKENSEGELTQKELLTIRFTHIPYSEIFYRSSISELDINNIDKLIIIIATVLRVAQRKTLEKQKIYKCAECSFEIITYSDPQDKNKLILPLKCPNMLKKTKKPNIIAQLVAQIKHKKESAKAGNCEKETKIINEQCGCRKFEFVPNTQLYIDYQEIKIQETFKTLKPGTIPKTLPVILEGNLVDKVKPGDDVMISGILIKRWGKIIPDCRVDVGFCIFGNSVNVLNKNEKNSKLYKKDGIIGKNKNDINLNENQNNPINEEFFEKIWQDSENNFALQLELRNNLIKSVCSKIYKKFELKLSILLTIIGGVTKTIDSTRIRGQCHLLFLGEPGTGKSQLLQFAHRLSERAVFTNGIGTTSAGLTIAFLKENGEWMVEAGALVLADMGVCCIDEFNLIKNTDYVSVHEVMEQQTISGAKAGITIKVNARTTIIGCCNPIAKGQKYDSEKGLVENSGLTTPLLSRFDLIFIVLDNKNESIDRKNCDFILSQFQINKNFNEENEDNLSENQLRAYIKIVQNRFEPIMTEQAEKIITMYYQHLRKKSTEGRNTVRMLESLARLSQAHARLMFKEKIEVFDVICIIVLMESAFDSGLLHGVDFSEYILLDEEKYGEIRSVLLDQLGFDYF